MTKQEQPNFEAAVAASQVVQTTINTLSNRRAQLRAEHIQLEAKKKVLLEQCIPLDDFKSFLVEYLDAKRKEFRASLCAEIEGFLHPPRGVAEALEKRKPLTFIEAETLLHEGGERNITTGPLSGRLIPQFLSPIKNFSNDLGYYFFFHEQITNVISSDFDSLGVKHYIADGEIGTPRAERRVQIAAVEDRLGEIGNELAQIADKLYELGDRS